MSKQIKDLLYSKVGIAILGGVIGLGIGLIVFDNGDVTLNLQEKNQELNSKLQEIEKEKEVLELKVEEANPWFLMSEDEKRQVENKQREDIEEEVKKINEIAANNNKGKVEDENKKEKENINKEIDILEKIKSDINSVIETELNGKIEDTILEKIVVNENLGTENVTEDVVVLINLKWNKQNGKEMTNTMLKMYGDHLAAKVASKLVDNSEICIFWDATYTGMNIKQASFVKDGQAYVQ